MDKKAINFFSLQALKKLEQILIKLFSKVYRLKTLTKKKSFRNIWIILLICSAWLVLCPLPARSCSVPVFQYALAYWTTDPYEVIVFHRSPLSAEQQAIVDRLQRASWDENSRVNVEIRLVDLAGTMDAMMQGVWESQKAPELPWMVVKYPRFSGITGDIWSGRFNADNVSALLDSPVRQEIVRRIIAGDAAVWIFLEGGVKQQDDAAASLLESQLNQVSESLNIAIPATAQEFFGKKDLSVKFSMVRLSRKDYGERIFIQTLIGSEWDLKTVSKPMAFPIFGRGRILYALVGDGIRGGNIEAACSYLAGWCACQVKEQNPGLDLLISANWDKIISEELYAQTRVLLQSTESTQASNSDLGNVKSNMKRNIIIALLVQIVFVAIVACVVLWLWRRRRKAEKVSF